MLFLTGDVRANQNIGLTSLHSLFLRFHNKVIRQLHTFNPSWKQDRLLRETRKIVSAIQQTITYDDFLPVVLGERFMQRFKLKIQSKVNPFNPLRVKQLILHYII